VTRASLRTWLAAVVLGPLLVASAGTALVIVPRAQAAAERLSVRLHRETGLRIRSEILPFLDVPHTANAANAELLASARSLTDEDWRRHLYRQLQGVPQVGYLQVGWASDGGFVGVERGAEGFVTEISDAGRTGKGVWALDGRGDPTGERRAFVDGYDARTRPWFRSAVAAGGPAWSPIYQFSSRDRVRLGITAVQPFVDEQGLVAVLGADLVLSQLSDLLRDHALGDGSRIALTERDGTLVASSAAVAPYRVGPDGAAARVSGTDCGDPTVDAAVRGAMGPDGTFADLAGEVAVRTGGSWIFAAPLTDGRGLDWVLVVAVPEGAVLGTLPADARAGLLLALLAITAGATGSFVLADRLTRPLRELTTAARELATGRFDGALPLATTAEAQALVSAFEAMRAEVRRTLDHAEAARQVAVEANSQKTMFLHGMSHELRTPLTAIIGYTDLLLDDAPPGSDQAQDLQRVRTAAHHLLSLINDVLDLARVESGKLVLSVAPVDLSALAREVGVELRPVAEARRDRLVVDAPDGGAVVPGDRARLRQILVNLVGNALKFTDGGTVRICVVPEPTEVRIDVVDTGIGFDPAIAPRLFEPYQRAPGVSSREGSGLGLAIVKRLAEAHGGRVSVDSAPGRGSTFRLHLPR
jgi:signal transduction histidine kinase